MKNFKFISVSAIIFFVLLATLDTVFGISLWLYILLFVVWFSAMAMGSFSMSWQMYMEAFTSKKNATDKKIAITFDDGPNPEFTLKVLQLLDDYQAKATFFCIGEHIENHPEILKAVAKNGHEIGNHSFSHDLLIDFNSTEHWLAEIKQTDSSIHKLTGRKTNLFRPPFGVTTPKLAKALKVTEHKIIGWNIRSYDTAIKNPETIVKRLIKLIKPGAVILLHDKQPNILPVLEHLLQVLKKEQYQTVTINQLLNEN